MLLPPENVETPEPVPAATARTRWRVPVVLRMRTANRTDDVALPSLTSVWRSAEFQEREAFDLFGIVFEGHPDLRRILMPEEFTAYPLRKDYPLRGRGERHNFRQGFFRFRLDGSRSVMEFLRSTNNNTWGLGFSEEGLVFGSTANRNPSVYMPIANRYYEAVRGWSRRRPPPRRGW